MINSGQLIEVEIIVIDAEKPSSQNCHPGGQRYSPLPLLRVDEGLTQAAGVFVRQLNQQQSQGTLQSEVG